MTVLVDIQPLQHFREELVFGLTCKRFLLTLCTPAPVNILLRVSNASLFGNLLWSLLQHSGDLRNFLWLKMEKTRFIFYGSQELQGITASFGLPLQLRGEGFPVPCILIGVETENCRKSPDVLGAQSTRVALVQGFEKLMNSGTSLFKCLELCRVRNILVIFRVLFCIGILSADHASLPPEGASATESELLPIGGYRGSTSKARPHRRSW
mmetsp:Transcript_4574/g.6419  ORF Transcript_4574/g.6419 Transcript_4574/m.6419 type:complete len:210 (+) Transcript_4574:437-1066(+)